MEKILNQIYDEERALYGSKNLQLEGCTFDGPADGESALKESSDIVFERGLCNLRYPFWHNQRLMVRDTVMTELCRAPLWYCDHTLIEHSKILGTKALRESHSIIVSDCDIHSAEFGWSVSELSMVKCNVTSEYLLLRAAQVSLKNVKMSGKYSFQYVRNAQITNSELDTKDAFWHSQNVTVKDSVIKGEYLGWYSNHLTLENCKIIGTQPLCYCTDLKLINCEMIDCDLAFEKSDVTATITAPVVSIKNPHSGQIVVPSVTEIIQNDPTAGQVVITTPDGVVLSEH